jgi:hypothetical protein
MNWKTGSLFLVGAFLVAGALLLTSREAAQGQAAKGGSYSVIATDGAHLIVTDNAANKLYFYTIDKEGKIGDELKLRGSLDLRDVGKPSLKPVAGTLQK